MLKAFKSPWWQPGWLKWLEPNIMSLISSLPWKFAKYIGINVREAHVSKLKWLLTCPSTNPQFRMICTENDSEGPTGSLDGFTTFWPWQLGGHSTGERDQRSVFELRLEPWFLFSKTEIYLVHMSFTSQPTSRRCATRQLQHPVCHREAPDPSHFCCVIPRWYHRPYWIIWGIQNTKCEETGI